MNKLKLIDTLRFEAEITKSEAAAVVRSEERRVG
mgnify:CR=1 FL=1